MLHWLRRCALVVRIMVFRLSLICCLSFLCAATAFAQTENPKPSKPEKPAELSLPRADELLAKMSAAIKNTDYSGEFTYEHGSQLESFRIIHQVVDGREFESLQRLTGAASQVERIGDPSCGTIGRQLLSGVQLESSLGRYFSIDRVYQSAVVRRERIAGREAWIVQLIPRDEFRFGIELAIDEQSFLPLRHLVFDARKKIALERTQFVSLNLGEVDSLPENAIEVSPEQCAGSSSFTPDGQSPWQPTWLPPGFISTGYQYDELHGHMETYTDGVSSFSVFVIAMTDTSAHDNRIQQGVASRGASMALVTSLAVGGDAQHISVIGEVPLSVANKVSLSIRRVSDPAVPES